MIKFSHIIIMASVLFLAGCGTKREYFEPKDIYANIVYTGSLPSSIKDVSRYGAVLENAQIITSKGLSSFALEEGFTFIGEFDGRLISANKSGLLHVMNHSGQVLYEKKFDRTVVVASVYKDRLAVVDAGNFLHLIDMTKDEIYFTNKQDSVYALSAKVAAPHFLNFLVLFPTLDGKLVIVDWKDGKLIRDVVISSEPFFNNLIFLDVIGDRLIAATSKRAISINPNKTNFLDESIKDVTIVNDKIVFMTNDGRVLVTNSDLTTLHERKFLFAVFVGSMSDEEIYIAERNGHLIVSDIQLEDVKIYELPDKIEKLIFMANDTIYFDNSLIKLHSK